MSALSLKKQQLLNALLFQEQWLICVQADNQLALISFTIVLLLHINVFNIESKEIALIVFFTLVGIIVESLAATLGLIEFPHQNEITAGGHAIFIVPLWLIIMWANFATTLCHCLAWLQSRIALTFLLTLIFIPLNYFLGAKISGSTYLVSPHIFLMYETALWLVLLPLGLWFSAQAGKSADRVCLIK